MENGLERVSPCNPVAPYIGGKRVLAPLIADIIASVPHTTYAEAFVGMGGVFFRRSLRPKAEKINDRSGDVANLFRILQRHYQVFLDVLKWRLTTRTEFERLLKVDPTTLTDLERAARFLYLQRTCFSGKVGSKSFGVSPGEAAGFDLTKLVPVLEAVYERLCSVTIENLDWSEFIDRYDRPGVLFYLDPPYYGCETDYGRDLFHRDDFARMAERLSRLLGHFILSINDKPEVREIFSAFHLREVSVQYSIGDAGGKDFAELLISNVDTVNLRHQESMAF